MLLFSLSLFLSTRATDTLTPTEDKSEPLASCYPRQIPVRSVAPAAQPIYYMPYSSQLPSTSRNSLYPTTPSSARVAQANDVISRREYEQYEAPYRYIIAGEPAYEDQENYYNEITSYNNHRTPHIPYSDYQGDTFYIREYDDYEDLPVLYYPYSTGQTRRTPTRAQSGFPVSTAYTPSVYVGPGRVARGIPLQASTGLPDPSLDVGYRGDGNARINQLSRFAARPSI
ncbi:hypothetical protein BLNAU_19821 [Blattamonas nauphoetae]|uniref:Uncharacterized protein n=1 Tax=Blattamonas nauphoetae TaxID=2049346 RepID=A0ABQ9X0F5_9EUKA|nr:hypothetical protein BLNAU_19821 [Blattamonas nauphoetae]